MRYEVEKTMVAEAAAAFPAEFTLRRFRGDGTRCRVSISDSYVSDGQVFLYVAIFADGKWQCFAKGTPQELTQEVV